MPMQKEKYPPWWDFFSYWVRFKRAEGRCECRGQCGDPVCKASGRCVEKHGEKGFLMRGKVILTVAHLDNDPENWDISHMKKRCKAMCQACHLRMDHRLHMKNSRKTRDRKRGQPPLLEVD